MHIIPTSRIPRRRAGLAAAFCILLLSAACGERGEAGGAASADTASAAMDTSAMGIARQALGPDVGMAIPYRIPHRNARFVAAAIPIFDWVTDVARSGSNVEPGGYEMVIVESTPESHAVHKPGLYTTRLPWLERLEDTTSFPKLDSAAIARMAGVEDVDGDGTPEVWAAQFLRGMKGYAWKLRAYDRNARTMYEATLGSVFGGEGLDATSFSFSGEVEKNPPAREWILRKARQLDSVYVDGRRRERAGDGLGDSAAPAEPGR